MDAREKTRQTLYKYYDKKGRTGTIGKNGYRLFLIRGIRIYEHRKIWEEAYGKIPKDCHVHHKNGNKLDNRIENLELIKKTEHTSKHAKKNGFGKNRTGCQPINKTKQIIINKIQELRKQGIYLKDICKQVNLSYPTVQKYAKGEKNGKA